MRIAVIGTGVAGLGAAYLLARTHDVEVFEREPVAGGHTRTIQVAAPSGEHLALDIGFIVHNERHYPNLIRMFRELGIATQDTQMSFAVSDPARGIEYSASRLGFQPRLLAHRQTRQLMLEILRFTQRARAALDGRAQGLTLGDFVAIERYSREFRDLFLLPLAASLWSTAMTSALAFPADYALRFLDNHGLLSIRRQHWRTVVGGASRYVQAILGPLGSRVHVGAPVRAVRRDTGGVDVVTDDGNQRRFDAVVIATHADQALRLLADPLPIEREILGGFAYTRNDVVLHTDERLLPRRQPVRSAWNYQVPAIHPDVPTVTYYLNRLQRLTTSEHYCVTLNRSAEIDESKVLHRASFEHPQYSFETLGAQARLPEISGGRTYYCGAYHGNGFHEAGFTSALVVATALGVRW